MLASLLIALTFAAATTTTLPAPGDGLGLAPEPRPIADLRPVPLPGWESPALPRPDGGGALPTAPITGLVALVAGGLAVLAGRSRRGDGDLVPPRNVDVIFVPGYGSGTGSFDGLIHGIGLAPGQVHEFDYRTVAPFTDHAAASRAARVGPTADGIAGLIAGLEQEGRWVYLVGFSKGGAALAHLIARWDGHPETRPTRVVGAALLDPAIASGAHGVLQSSGTCISRVPDDGGYDPHEWSIWGRHDTRINLGGASGIATMVIRNTDSWPAGFLDSPPGLRIYDVEDRGGPGFEEIGGGTGPMVDRMGEAHASARDVPETADCIRAELWRAGGCEWPEPARPPARPQPSSLGRSGGGAGVNLLR